MKLFTTFLVVLFFTGFWCMNDEQGKSAQKKQPNYASLRQKMVERQIIARGLKDSLVIDAMQKVPRHLY